MRTFLTPTKDASIYSRLTTMNAGLDEVLYIGKDSGSNHIRSLMQFDLTTTSQSISNSSIPLNCNFYINLKLANATSISDNLIAYIYPISQSWTEGTGLSIQETSNPTDGASWIYNTHETQWDMVGGSYINTPTSSFQFTTPIQDIRADVTPIVRSWISGTISNNGVLIKISDLIENSISSSDNIAIFSKDTHTIYKPTLEIAWDDQSFVTGSLESAPETNLHISLRSLKSVYNRNVVSRVNISSRELYPLKTFDTIFRYNTTKYLPITTYFSIIDIQTNETIIPFDDYSKVSCDDTGNYFILNTSNLYKGRKYSISIKVVSGEYTDIFNMDNNFEVI